MRDENIKAIKEARRSYRGVGGLGLGEGTGFYPRHLRRGVSEFSGRSKSERRGERIDSGAGYRNGYGNVRRISLMGGPVRIFCPRVRDAEVRFKSRILPLFVRRTKEVTEMLAELYLQGLALGDFELALRGLLGEGAPL